MVKVPVSFVIGAGIVSGDGGACAASASRPTTPPTAAPTVVSAMAPGPPAPAAFRKCLRENFISDLRLLYQADLTFGLYASKRWTFRTACSEIDLKIQLDEARQQDLGRLLLQWRHRGGRPLTHPSPGPPSSLVHTPQQHRRAKRARTHPSRVDATLAS